MNRILSRGPLAVAALLLTASLGASKLEAQTTFTACRVPDVGAIYMIGVSGAPSACLDASHIEFSWTEGGSLADGSVTEAKLAFDPATQTELDGVTSDLGTAGTLNDAANPVDWTKLKGVPADIADGDDTGGASNDVSCTGCVDEADIADGAVTTAKIATGSVDPSRLGSDVYPARAWGSIASDGTVNIASPNVSVFYDMGLNRYQISFSDFGYNFAQDVAVVTTAVTAATFASTNSVSGDLLVYIYDTAANQVQDTFHFVVF